MAYKNKIEDEEEKIIISARTCEVKWKILTYFLSSLHVFFPLSSTKRGNDVSGKGAKMKRAKNLNGKRKIWKPATAIQ